MAKVRSYKLLCPIARGLDRIGDRWTLLILRDLHAGPARFSDLQHGLTGIAANLLTDRLNKLVSDGLISKDAGAHGTTLYSLTDLGCRTRNILFDLALFGGQFAPEGEVVDPGNMRTVAVTLGTACQRAITGDINLEVQFIINDEPFALLARDCETVMQAGQATAPDVMLETSYEALLSVSEGEIDMAQFAQDHCRLDINTPGKEAELMQLMSAAIAVFSG
ncbi:winged helix-turn-helix transcriptional regulator [Anderseniella sp. Alg231-50]|uniref:winged helix-turn-helix transcriptional regulator n=1 Tax=Anderseniella sp. Alg231-50 TaxID=1922226 RepID=UPI000D5595D5